MNLGQYYTPKSYSTLLIENMHSISADSVLDIGCGQASLLNAASKRWRDAKLIGYDVDPKNINKAVANIHLGFGNGFDPDLSKKIIDTFGHIDISVANPPYTHVEVNSEITKILKLSELFQCIPRNTKKIPAEIVFLAQNFLVLKEGGELGAILPASIVSGEKWKALREFLITEKSLSKVIQLPQKAFCKTEASTFAVNFKNLPTNASNITLMSSESSNLLNIGKENGAKRLDYSYHANKRLHSNLSSRKFNSSIFRGNQSSKLLRLTGKDFLHTSNLKNHFQYISLPNNKYPENSKVATKGDIVISRVGTRCVGKSALITRGCVEVSDCIVVIRGDSNLELIEQFQNGSFYNAAINNVLGTGAKYLTFDIIKEVLNSYEL